MADDNVINNIDGLNKSLLKTEVALKHISDLLTNISGGFGKMASSGGASGGFGQQQLGVAAGGGVMDNSLGSFSTVGSILGASRKTALFSGVAQGLVSAVSGAAGGAMMAMPDVQGTTNRSTGYYNASLYGGTNMTRLGLAGFSAMRGGIQSAGMDAAVAQTLAAQGVMPSTQAGSQFMNMMRATGNITQFTNMGNIQGAQAMAGLHTGSMSANLMRNFGIFTTDPNSGKQYTSSQILGQMQDRLTMGGTIKLTQAQLMQQRQAGALGQDLQNSGLSQDQQDLLFQGMMYTSKTGKQVDWANKKQVASLASAIGNTANRNPQAANYAIASAQTGTQQAAMNSYITGMDAAAKAVTQFQQAITNFLNSPAGKTMASANAGIQTGMQDNAVKGAVSGVAGLAGGAMQIGNAFATNKLLKSIASGMGSETAAAASAAAKVGAGTLAKVGGVTAGVLGAAQLAGDAMSGQGWGSKQFSGDMGGTIGGLVGGIGGSFFGPIGTIAGGYLGSTVGNWIGSAIGGDSSTINTGSTTDTTGSLKLVAPVKGPITCKYGTVDKMHPTGHHGVDYGVPVGTPVQAAADGVISSISNSGDFGLYVEIDHGNGYKTLYGHLSASQCSIGMPVKQGQVIALSGDSGRSTGPHVHLGAFKNGGVINPATLGLGGSVAIVAGNANSTASNSAGGSYYAGSQDLTGFNSGSNSAGGANIPQSYSGASIASQAVSVASMGSPVNGQSAKQSSSMPGVSTGGVGGDGGPSIKGGNTVNISLSLPNTSISEARKFAALVKEYLEQDTLTANMGRL